MLVFSFLFQLLPSFFLGCNLGAFCSHAIILIIHRLCDLFSVRSWFCFAPNISSSKNFSFTFNRERMFITKFCHCTPSSFVVLIKFCMRITGFNEIQLTRSTNLSQEPRIVTRQKGKRQLTATTSLRFIANTYPYHTAAHFNCSCFDFLPHKIYYRPHSHQVTIYQALNQQQQRYKKITRFCWQFICWMWSEAVWLTHRGNKAIKMTSLAHRQ